MLQDIMVSVFSNLTTFVFFCFIFYLISYYFICKIRLHFKECENDMYKKNLKYVTNTLKKLNSNKNNNEKK